MSRLSRPARRLLVAVLFLAGVDAIEPLVLSRLESRRYEDPSRDFRFASSDLFGVGPLVAYLREHPAGRQPRVMFLGNSMTYGYGLSESEAIPGQYQRLDRSEKILNVGVNSFDLSSAYLVAKASFAAIDRAYVLCRTDTDPTHVLIARRVPLEPADARRFALPPESEIEQGLARFAARWALYRDAYRLQAALFGTSSRYFLYMHKGDAARSVLTVLRAAQDSPPAGVEDIPAVAPIAAAAPGAERLAALRRVSPEVLWDFAELFRNSGKSVALLQVPGFAEWLPDAAAVADFNRAHTPHARIVIVGVPPDLTLDGMHPNPAGAALMARALWRERAIHDGTAR